MLLTSTKLNYGFNLTKPLIFEVIAFLIFFFFKYLVSSILESIYRKSRIKDVDKFTGEQFENWLKVLFEDYGFQVEKTKRTGDYGADLILKKGNDKIAVQAKRYKGNVGVKAVQEVIGSAKYYGCNGAVVCTNSYFTENAKNLAKANEVILYDRDKLIELSLGRNK